MSGHGDAETLKQTKQSQANSLEILESEARVWIEEILGVCLPGPLADELKNGVRLCELVSKIQPGIAPKPSTSQMPFKMFINMGFTTQTVVNLNKLIHLSL